MHEAIDKLIPAAPTDLGPLSWIAVVVVGVLLAVYLINSLVIAPRQAKNRDDAHVKAIEKLATSHETAVNRIAETHESAVNRLHDRLDTVEHEAAVGHGEVLRAIDATRRDIVRLDCYSGTASGTEEIASHKN